jgi:hypothetical protein
MYVYINIFGDICVGTFAHVYRYFSRLKKNRGVYGVYIYIYININIAPFYANITQTFLNNFIRTHTLIFKY